MLQDKRKLDEIDISFPGWSVANGLTAVIERITGMKMVAEKATEMNTSYFRADFSGAFVLLGERKAMFSIHADRRSAVEIITAMTKLPGHSLDDRDLADGMTELANIVGGDVKARLGVAEGPHIMLLPFAVAGSDHSFLYKTKGPIFIRMLRAGEVTLIIQGHSIDVR